MPRVPKAEEISRAARAVQAGADSYRGQQKVVRSKVKTAGLALVGTGALGGAAATGASLAPKHGALHKGLNPFKSKAVASTAFGVAKPRVVSAEEAARRGLPAPLKPKTPVRGFGKADRDQNSSVGTTISWQQPQGDFQTTTMRARPRGQERSRGVGRHLTRDQNSSPGVVRMQPRSPQGKYVSHEADLKVFQPIGRKGKKRGEAPSGRVERYTNSGARMGHGVKKNLASPMASALLSQAPRRGRRLA